jgi:AraC-like DNA-binding protein
MLASPLSGSLGKLMMEANFLQFIALQLNALFCENQSLTVSEINHRDRAIMHAVKDHLSTNFDDDHSLASLARMFGISESKLVKGFRQVFGTTVFAFLADVKMDHARILLADHSLSVAGAARQIGYKNPHHFSAAFTKKFGFNPSRLKR